MDHRRTLVWLAVIAMCSAVSSSGQATSRPWDSQERRALIKRFDKDGDGKLGREERRAAQKELLQRGSEQIAARILPSKVKAIRDVAFFRKQFNVKAPASLPSQ